MHYEYIENNKFSLRKKFGEPIACDMIGQNLKNEKLIWANQKRNDSRTFEGGKK